MLPFEFFFNKQSLKNILSFAAVAYNYRIIINTELEPSVKLHLHDGTRIIFKKFRGGPYNFDINNEAFD